MRARRKRSRRVPHVPRRSHFSAAGIASSSFRFLRVALQAGASAAWKGRWVGLCLTVPYWISWLTIAVIGNPGPAWWAVSWFAIGAVAAAGALFGLLARPRSLHDWRIGPLFVAITLAITFLGWAFVDTSFTAVLLWGPLLLVTLIGMLVVIGTVVPLALLLALARAESPRRPWRALWARYRASGWRGWSLWVVEFVAWITAGGLVILGGTSAFQWLFPYPALAAAAVGLLYAGITAFIAGRLGARLLQASGGPVAIAPSAPISGRHRAIAAGVAGLGLAVVLLFSGNVSQAILLASASRTFSVSMEAAQTGLPLMNLNFGTMTIGTAYTEDAVAQAAAGQSTASVASLAQAMWWAPQSPVVLCSQAWLAVNGQQQSTVRPAVTALATSGSNGPCLDQVLGTEAWRTGQRGRSLFFEALSADPLIDLAEPVGVPPPGPTGTHSQELIATALINGQRAIFADAVGWLDQSNAFAAAQATSNTVLGLMTNAPRPLLQPTWEQGFYSAYALDKSGDVQGTQNALGQLFAQAHTQAQKEEVAVLSMTLAAGPAHAEAANFAAIAKYAQDSQGKPGVAWAVYELSQQQHAQAASTLEHILKHQPSLSVRAEALAVLAEDQYVEGDFASAIRSARLSLREGAPGVQAIDNATLGDSLLAEQFPHPKPAAIHAIETALSQDPEAFMLWDTLGMLRLDTGHPGVALQDFRRALAERDLVVSEGLGAYQVVVSSNAGSGQFWALGSGSYGQPLITKNIQAAIAAIKKEHG